MEMKLFRGQGTLEIDQLEQKVNAWLKTLPTDVEVKHVSTAMTAAPPGGNPVAFPICVITAWWGKK